MRIAKNAKTIDTWFFPVDPVFVERFSRWVRHLKEVRFFGPDDALLQIETIVRFNFDFPAVAREREGQPGAVLVPFWLRFGVDQEENALRKLMGAQGGG